LWIAPSLLDGRLGAQLPDLAQGLPHPLGDGQAVSSRGSLDLLQLLFFDRDLQALARDGA